MVHWKLCLYFVKDCLVNFLWFIFCEVSLASWFGGTLGYDMKRGSLRVIIDFEGLTVGHLLFSFRCFKRFNLVLYAFLLRALHADDFETYGHKNGAATVSFVFLQAFNIYVSCSIVVDDVFIEKAKSLYSVKEKLHC